MPRVLAKEVSGSQLLAHGAIEAGVQFVTGYPGSPSTSVVDGLKELAGDQLDIEWAINEKSAFDTAFGASLAGMRALVCLKSVGLNVALDSLMVSNLAAGDGGFVILVGDDPGGWGSQNEEDSRLLVAAAEIPLFEPSSLTDAGSLMRYAFDLSERFRVPVAVRITRAMTKERIVTTLAPFTEREQREVAFPREPDRFNVLPIHVVPMHQRLQTTMQEIQALPGQSLLNGVQGRAAQGVLAAGFAYHKLKKVLDQSNDPPLSVLHLSTLKPLPEGQILEFLANLNSLLVLEETAPFIEIQAQALAQRAGLHLPVYGRSNGHLPGAGEIFGLHIVQALKALLPAWSWPALEQDGRTMPSRQPLCDDCPYIPTFQALLSVLERHGGRDAFVITGETGCMVRAQLPPWELLDAKYAMGSSIGLAAGIARTGVPQKVVALSGDSALLHSGLGELIDAAQAGIDLLVVVLANEITALSGGQPHPGTAHDTQGRRRKPVDLYALAQAAGAVVVHEVDPEEQTSTEAALEDGLTSDGLAVVIARRACPMWE